MRYLFPFVNGIASGMAIFLVAAGITLIFGLLKILNFAHGAFFMVGAYVAFTLVGDTPTSVSSLIFAAAAGGVVVGLCGYIVDRVVLTRLNNVDPHYVLIATFGLMLIVSGAVKLIWGVDVYSASPPDPLAGAVVLGGVRIPSYSLFVIVAGVLIFLLLDLAIHRLWIGKIMQSMVHDSWIVRLLGYNAPRLYTFVVVSSFFLAGLAGGLMLPNQSLSPLLGENYIILGFITVIIGGLGNIRGAFVAALLLGLIDNIGPRVLPIPHGIAIYLSMVLALLVRPQGLFGKFETNASIARLRSPRRALSESAFVKSVIAERLHQRHGQSPAFSSATSNQAQSSPVWIAGALAVAVIVLLMPFWADPTLLFVTGLLLPTTVFALSWNLLFSYSGVISFGHAAFYGIGAYTSGVVLKMGYGLPFIGSIALAGLLAAIIALAVGAIALRRASGIYLAIVTMALAEILRLLVGYSKFLGQDDGLMAMPRPMLELGFATISLSSDRNYFWFMCCATALLTGCIWWVVRSRYGRVLNALRQDPERASFLGVNVAGFQLAVFVFSAAIAAMAGSLTTPWAQIVAPEIMSLGHSTLPILATLLGGVGSFWGPVLGSVVYAFIEHETRNLAGLSEIVIGGLLLVIILSAPNGLVGLLQHLAKRLRLALGAWWGKGPLITSLGREESKK